MTHVIIAIIILMGSLLLGVSIPFAFGAGTIYMYFMLDGTFATTLPVGFNGINTMVLLSIPTFIMAGGFIERGKIGDELVSVVEMFVGRFRGGLMLAISYASAIFGAICGSAAATCSCIGSIMAPKLKRAGYSDGISAAPDFFFCSAGSSDSAQLPYDHVCMGIRRVRSCMLFVYRNPWYLPCNLAGDRRYDLIQTGRCTGVRRLDTHILFCRPQKNAQGNSRIAASCNHSRRYLWRNHDAYRSRLYLHPILYSRSNLYLQRDEMERRPQGVYRNRYYHRRDYGHVVFCQHAQPVLHL